MYLQSLMTLTVRPPLLLGAPRYLVRAKSARWLRHLRNMPFARQGFGTRRRPTILSALSRHLAKSQITAAYE
jgi:hypothetical protein